MATYSGYAYTPETIAQWFSTPSYNNPRVRFVSPTGEIKRANDFVGSEALGESYADWSIQYSPTILNPWQDAGTLYDAAAQYDPNWSMYEVPDISAGIRGPGRTAPALADIIPTVGGETTTGGTEPVTETPITDTPITDTPITEEPTTDGQTYEEQIADTANDWVDTADVTAREEGEGTPAADVYTDVNPVETDLQNEETAGAEVAGYEFIDTDGDGRNDSIVDADGNVMWDLDQVRAYIDQAAATGASLPDMELWLRENGFIAEGETVANFLQPPEIAAAPTPPELQTLGLAASDTNGDGQIDAITDADGNVVYQLQTPSATINLVDSDGDGVNDTIVDENGNPVVQLSELQTGTDITGTEAYQQMGTLADLLGQGGITEEDRAAAMNHAGQLFGMSGDQLADFLRTNLQELSGGIAGQQGLSEEQRSLAVRDIQGVTRNAELRAERLLDNVMAETGSATRYYSQSQELLYNIQNTELQGYVALAQQDYEARVAEYEAQERMFGAMVDAGNASRGDYLNLVASNRATALNSYSQQVQAILEQNQQQIGASLENRRQEYDLALQKYGMNLDSYMATQTNWLDAISKLSDIVNAENAQQLGIYGQQSANWQATQQLATQQWETYTGAAGEFYDNDVATLNQIMENLYTAANAEFGLNTEVLNYIMSNAEFDWAEVQQEFDAALSQLQVDQADQDKKTGWIFSLLQIIASIF